MLQNGSLAVFGAVGRIWQGVKSAPLGKRVRIARMILGVAAFIVLVSVPPLLVVYVLVAVQRSFGNK
jgi:hypothetical protein